MPLKLGKTLRNYHEATLRFGGLFDDADRLDKRISEELSNKVSKNGAYQNAKKNPDRQNAKIERDKAQCLNLDKIPVSQLSCDLLIPQKRTRKRAISGFRFYYPELLSLVFCDHFEVVTADDRFRVIHPYNINGQ